MPQPHAAVAASCLDLASTAIEPTPALEAIGIQMAICAGALAEALTERRTGALTSATRTYGGNAIARLYELRQATVGKLDFDRVAREHGVRLLLEHGGTNDISAATIDTLVGGVLEILHKLVRSQSN
jgi:hypothetical protein